MTRLGNTALLRREFANNDIFRSDHRTIELRPRWTSELKWLLIIIRSVRIHSSQTPNPIQWSILQIRWGLNANTHAASPFEPDLNMMFFRFRTVTKEDDKTYKVTMVGAIPNTMLRLLSTTSLFVMELLMRSPMASPQSRIGVWLIKSPVQSFVSALESFLC